MTSHHHQSSPSAGLVPAQWFLRLVGVAMVAGAFVALAATRHELKRYVRIKQM